MTKPSILLLSGNAEIGDDYINYLGLGANPFFDPVTGNLIPAAPADVRTNFMLSEGELNLNYNLNSPSSSFSINMWSQSDNLILTFNEHPSFCIVKKVDANGVLTPMYTVGHSNAIRVGTPTSLSVRHNNGFITVSVDNVDIVKHPFISSGLSLSFYAFGNDGLILSDINVNTMAPKVFVVMQFKQEYNELYAEVIKPVCEQMGIKVVRVDESSKNGSIIQEIKKEIIESSFVIADITPDNPNVYYEVGFAHGIKKSVILMCNEQREKLPFDLVDVRTIFYRNSIAGNSAVKERLSKQIAEILEPSKTHI